MPAAPATTTPTSSISFTPIELLTIFTPPAFCSSVPYTLYDENDGTQTFWKNVNNLDDPKTSSCYPPNYALQHSPGITAQYSPGVCPSGYFGISREQHNDVSTSICCPSGASWHNKTLPGDCHSTITTSTTVVSSGTTITLRTPAEFRDWYLQIAWNSDDLSKFTPASAPILANISSTVSSSASALVSVTSSSSSSSDVSNTSSSGVSGGAIAGIVIGAVAAIALILCAVFFGLQWKKHATTRHPVAAPTVAESTMYGPVYQLDPHDAPAELHNGGHGKYHDKPELPTSNEKSPGKFDARSELPGN